MGYTQQELDGYEKFRFKVRNGMKTDLNFESCERIKKLMEDYSIIHSNLIKKILKPTQFYEEYKDQL